MLRGKKPCHQPQQGAFSGAGVAHDRHPIAGLQDEINGIEYRTLRVVMKAHLFERQPRNRFTAERSKLGRNRLMAGEQALRAGIDHVQL